MKQDLIAATYNVHKCVGTDKINDVARIARVIEELDADIIGLQEVESHLDVNPEMAHLEALAEQTRYTVIPGPTIIGRDSTYGNILLTRYPVLHTRLFDISMPRREPRGVIDSVMETDHGRVRIIVTHFGVASRERWLQAKMLLDIAQSMHAPLLVVMGDMNEWHPLNRKLRILERWLGKSPAPCTFPSRFPLLSLDRIWVRPRRALKGLHVYRSGLSLCASDHLPLKATVSLI